MSNLLSIVQFPIWDCFTDAGEHWVESLHLNDYLPVVSALEAEEKLKGRILCATNAAIGLGMEAMLHQ